jgi:competence protein ComEA
MRNKTRHLAWILSAAIAVAGLGAAVEAAEGKVNINEASVEQLALLPRVGPAVAQRIVDFREENGSFKAVEDLMLVRGIGEKTFEKLAAYVAISGKTTLSEKVRSSGGTAEGDDRR